ncbi:hypothetical protein MTP10_11920 [Nonomuraea sp. 3-1Str]|uniref:hypothetical protein n=1 Tax=Nonomuraea sp. 3-1Str TaxID=2929801 RepID=UPI00285C4443|nr:hypothetical protein [Nonomuraea sp. 3-1Str]MDR8409448.1 hypothetical protein [Nonomuraea sp. 3-1Str]
MTACQWSIAFIEIEQLAGTEFAVLTDLRRNSPSLAADALLDPLIARRNRSRSIGTGAGNCLRREGDGC